MSSSDDPHASEYISRRRPESSSTKEYIKEIEHVDVDETEHETRFPNAWSRYREMVREPFAEFLGTMILIIFGTGVDAQVVLGGNTLVTASEKGAYFSINVGWAVGTAMGVWLAGGVSGGHLNPAVTLSFAVFRGFSWKKVPVFILAQVLGALCGAAIVYATYFHALDLAEGTGVRTLATAGIFSTYAQDYMTNVSCFFSEFVGAAMLLFGVLAINDKENSPPPSGLNPLVLFLLILGIGASLGFQTGYAINPARDFGPRVFTAMAGYGKEVFTYRSHYWIWCPIMGPILGALVATFIYDTMLYRGGDSIMNKPNAAARRRHEHARFQSRAHMPAGIDAPV